MGAESRLGPYVLQDPEGRPFHEKAPAFLETDGLSACTRMQVNADGYQSASFNFDMTAIVHTMGAKRPGRANTEYSDGDQ